MSDPRLNWQRKYTVTATYYGPKALKNLLFPSFSKDDHPLKQALLPQLRCEKQNGLVRNCPEDRKYLENPLSAEELAEELEKRDYECWVAEIKDEKPPLLVGYRLKKIASTTIVKGAAKGLNDEEGYEHIPILTGVRVRADKIRDEEEKEEKKEEDPEDKVIIGFLDDATTGSCPIDRDLLITINSLKVIKESLRELTLHVQRNTSFWYGGFFGSKKESALQRIANNLQRAPAITSEEAKEYFLDIAYAVLQTRGSGHRFTDEKITTPTKSGEAFLRQVFCKGGSFIHLSSYFGYSFALTENNPHKSDKDRRGDENKNVEEKRKEKFNLIYNQLITEVGLRKKETTKSPCCPRRYQEVEAKESPKDNKNRYIRSLARSTN